MVESLALLVTLILLAAAGLLVVNLWWLLRPPVRGLSRALASLTASVGALLGARLMAAVSVTGPRLFAVVLLLVSAAVLVRSVLRPLPPRASR